MRAKEGNFRAAFISLSGSLEELGAMEPLAPSEVNELHRAWTAEGLELFPKPEHDQVEDRLLSLAVSNAHRRQRTISRLSKVVFPADGGLDG